MKEVGIWIHSVPESLMGLCKPFIDPLCLNLLFDKEQSLREPTCPKPILLISVKEVGIFNPQYCIISHWFM